MPLNDRKYFMLIMAKHGEAENRLAKRSFTTAEKYKKKADEIAVYHSNVAY
jgi:hypothetical protein